MALPIVLPIALPMARPIPLPIVAVPVCASEKVEASGFVLPRKLKLPVGGSPGGQVGPGPIGAIRTGANRP